jgi:hypothetical protein
MGGKVEIVANAAGICKQLEWEKTLDVNVVRQIHTKH